MKLKWKKIAGSVSSKRDIRRRTREREEKERCARSRSMPRRANRRFFDATARYDATPRGWVPGANDTGFGNIRERSGRLARAPSSTRRLCGIRQTGHRSREDGRRHDHGGGGGDDDASRKNASTATRGKNRESKKTVKLRRPVPDQFPSP